MPDVVLSLPNDGENIDAVRKQELKTVGLVLATHNQTVKDHDDRIRRFLVSMIDLLIKQGYKVICIPFQVDTLSSSNKAVDEIHSAQMLRQEVKDPKLFEVLDRMMSPTETLSYLRRHISVVVSMRLHGNIMAAAAGVPFISLSYNDKHKGFLEMMRTPEYDVPLDQDVLRTEPVRDLLSLIEKDYMGVSRHICDASDLLRIETKKQVEAVRRKYGL